MKGKLSEGIKVAHINGRYLIIGTILTVIFSALIAYFLNYSEDVEIKSENIQHQINQSLSNQKISDSLAKETQTNNNTIIQQNSQNSNAQIGTNIKK